MRALYAAPARARVHSRALDLLKGHPKEHQHSAWHLHASNRDAGPSAPGEGLNIFLRAGWKPERAETRNPGTGSKGLGKPR